jgi:cell division protein FtsZ
MHDSARTEGTILSAAGARLAVVGVGGGGGNAVNRMCRGDGFADVTFLALNTDARALEASDAPTRIPIGQRRTRGLGAGGRPDVGRDAIEESRDAVERALRGYDLVFVTCGMGGGTGTGAAPVIAELARESGALVVAVVTTPFLFEGRKRHQFAVEGVAALRGAAHNVLVVPNERLISIVGAAMTLTDAFHKADEILVHAARGVTSLVSVRGLVNVDFADVRFVLSRGGAAHIGLGRAAGAPGGGRAIDAASRALTSPLLESSAVASAEAVLVNIGGGPDMTLSEVHDATETVHAATGPDAEIIFGAVTDERLDASIEVTVIAAGPLAAAPTPSVLRTHPFVRRTG